MIGGLVPWALAIFASILAGLHFSRPKTPAPEPDLLNVPLPPAPPPEPRETAVKQQAATVPATLPESDRGPLPKKLKHMLDTFCTAIRDFEGAPGDLNYRNNNPGNFRCSNVGYLPKYGNVKCVGGFACFPTYELGWEYLQASVLHWAYLHPTWTIRDFFFHYAPPADNNPTAAYAANVAAKCGVPVSTTLRDLLG